MKWSSQRRPMAGFVGSSIFDGFVACLAAPVVLWVPESLPACGSLCRPVAACAAGLRRIRTDWMPLIEEFGDIEAWRPEASMPGCNVGWLAGCLGWLASLAGWLGWLAAAGGLLLAGCCNEKGLSRSTLQEVGGLDSTEMLRSIDLMPMCFTMCIR